MNDLEERQHFRNTFFTPSGEVVLMKIMREGYFFNSGEAEVTADMPEAIGKRNLVTFILSRLATADNPEANYRAVIESFKSLPILTKPKRKKEDEE